jgi:hypothetical protein
MTTGQAEEKEKFLATPLCREEGDKRPEVHPCRPRTELINHWHTYIWRPVEAPVCLHTHKIVAPSGR